MTDILNILFETLYNCFTLFRIYETLTVLSLLSHSGHVMYLCSQWCNASPAFCALLQLGIKKGM